MADGPPRAAFFCPLPDLGHLAPLLRVALAARRAGLAIRLFGPDELTGFVGRFDVDFHPYGAVRPDGYKEALLDATSAGWARRVAWAEPRLREAKLRQARAIAARLPEIEAGIRAFEPDLLMVDDHPRFLRECRAMAGHLGLPWGMNSSEGTCRARVDEDAPAPEGGRAARALEAAGEVVARVGLSARSRLRGEGGYRSAARAHARSLAAFRGPQPGPEPAIRLAAGLGGLEVALLGRAPADPRVTVVGALPPLRAGELDAETTAWLAADPRPVVYVGFGTMVQPREAFQRALAAAVGALGARLLWAHPVRPALDPARDRWAPFVDQPAVLAHPAVRAFVAHGGAGGLQEAVWSGVPLVVVPVAWDQHYNAELARSLGVAEVLDHRVDRGPAIEAALRRRLFDGDARARSAARATALRGLDGEARVGELLTGLGRRGAPRAADVPRALPREGGAGVSGREADG